MKFCPKTGLTHLRCSPFLLPVACPAAAQAALEKEATAQAAQPAEKE